MLRTVTVNWLCPTKQQERGGRAFHCVLVPRGYVGEARMARHARGGLRPVVGTDWAVVLSRSVLDVLGRKAGGKWAGMESRSTFNLVPPFLLDLFSQQQQRQTSTCLILRPHPKPPKTHPPTRLKGRVDMGHDVTQASPFLLGTSWLGLGLPIGQLAVSRRIA